MTTYKQHTFIPSTTSIDTPQGAKTLWAITGRFGRPAYGHGHVSLTSQRDCKKWLNLALQVAGENPALPAEKVVLQASIEAKYDQEF